MDNIPKLPNEELAETQSPAEDEAFNTQKTPAKVNIRRNPSILSQIYEWSITGQAIRLELPFASQDNYPLLAIRHTPLWISLNKMFHLRTLSTATIANGYFGMYSLLMPLLSPVGIKDRSFTDYKLMPEGLSIIEYDDEPLLTLMALHHLAYTGGIEIMVQLVGNSTTQGRFAFSNKRNVQQARIFTNFMRERTVLNMPMTSKRNRLDNAFSYLNPQQSTSCVLQNDRFDMKTWINIPKLIENAAGYGTFYSTDPMAGSYAQHEMFTFIDIEGSLGATAGLQQIEMRFWIRAMPNFQFSGPLVPGAGFMSSKYSYISDGRPVVRDRTRNTQSVTKNDFTETPSSTEV